LQQRARAIRRYDACSGNAIRCSAAKPSVARCTSWTRSWTAATIRPVAIPTPSKSPTRRNEPDGRRMCERVENRVRRLMADRPKRRDRRSAGGLRRRADADPEVVLHMDDPGDGLDDILDPPPQTAGRDGALQRHLAIPDGDFHVGCVDERIVRETLADVLPDAV